MNMKETQQAMNKIDSNKLLISSDFYSVQGEGKSTGVPSYFVRLGLCNLTCGMSRLFANKLIKEKSLEDGDCRDLDMVFYKGLNVLDVISHSQWSDLEWQGSKKYKAERDTQAGIDFENSL